ncbi:MAG: DNA translocase FtsK [Heteroscytonema crispum UTEX LB 1556]
MSNYTNAEILKAVIALKSQGLCNQEIITEAEEVFDLNQQFYIANILQESDFGSKIIRPVKNYDYNYLFEIIYQAVVSGTPDEQIIQICSEELNLEDLAFSKLSLEYILTNRYINKYEKDAFIVELYKQYQECKSYHDLIKIADSIKNIYLKQLVYKTAELVAHKTGEISSLSNNMAIAKNDANANTNQDTALIEERLNCQEGNILVETLNDFGITCSYSDTKVGPTFKRVKIKLAKGVSFKKVQGLGSDLVQQLGEQLGFENPPMISVIPSAVVFDIPRCDRQKFLNHFMIRHIGSFLNAYLLNTFVYFIYLHSRIIL